MTTTYCSLHTVQIVRQAGDEAPRLREYSTQPEARVRLLAAEVTEASELQAGYEAVLTDGGGAICGPPSRHERFGDLGTTPALVVAEAFKLSFTHYKASHVSALEMLGSKGERVLVFHDQVIKTWLHLQGLRNAAVRRSLCDDEAATGSASASASGRSSRDGDSSGGSRWPALDRESFEVAVAAFKAFREEPHLFGDWRAGSELHTKAVTSMAYGIRSAFEVEVAGPWQQPSDDWLQPADSQMPGEMFETLLSECNNALALRHLRNSTLAHPFSNPDPEVRQQLFELFREEVADEGGRVVSKMRHVAVAAVAHVESMLARAAANEQAESKRVVEPGRMLPVEDIT